MEALDQHAAIVVEHPGTLPVGPVPGLPPYSAAAAGLAGAAARGIRDLVDADGNMSGSFDPSVPVTSMSPETIVHPTPVQRGSASLGLAGDDGDRLAALHWPLRRRNVASLILAACPVMRRPMSGFRLCLRRLGGNRGQEADLAG